jgi:SAM-dependent methyltransferase
MILENEGIRCHSAAICALCGSAGKIVLTGLRDSTFGSPGTWGFRMCTDPRCRLVWLDPMPDDDETLKLYEGYYTRSSPQHTASCAPLRPRWKNGMRKLLMALFPGRRHLYAAGLSYLEDLPPGRLLDVGCGNGDFLRQAAAAGWQPVGVDFDAAAVNAVRELDQAVVRVGDLLSIGFPAASFDAVVMNNVIEHLPRPRAVLEECRRILRPGGRLVAITPSTASLGYRRYSQDWRGLEVPRHLYLFSPKLLGDLATAAGFASSTVFSTPGGAYGMDMMRASELIRSQRLHGQRAATAWSTVPLALAELLGVVLGVDVGEWCVVVATA